MPNEANIFYKPLRRVSFCENTPLKKEKMSKVEASEMHVISLTCDEPAKLTKSPRLKVCKFTIPSFRLLQFKTFLISVYFIIIRNLQFHQYFKSDNIDFE